jgi:heme exporter protein A
MKPQFALTIHNCAKTYNNHEFVFSPCSAELHNGEIIGITGWNGSGKSTLIKMVAGLLKPSNGSIHLKINNETYNYGEFSEHIGLVSPYLQVYEEFTPIEHAKIYCDLSGIPFNLNYTHELLTIMGLFSKRNENIRNFSSGMKQRTKYVLAFIRKPLIVLLDEPTANFDSKGTEAIYELINTHKNLGGGTIIATNDLSETEICSSVIHLTTI